MDLVLLDYSIKTFLRMFENFNLMLGSWKAWTDKVVDDRVPQIYSRFA